MRKDIALAGKIDTEHRSRQNLRHGALRDVSVLPDRATNIPRQRTPLKASAFKERRSLVHRYQAISRSPLRVGAAKILTSRLTELFQRYGRQVFAKFLTFPPRAGLAKFIHRCESVAIKHCSNKSGGWSGNGLFARKSFTSREPRRNRKTNATNQGFCAEFPRRRTTSASRVSAGAAHTNLARVLRRRVSI